jgi:Tfp pilus assembly protein PilX
MKLRLKQGDRGAVALMTSIIISILLTIITTGLVSVMASELRQSSDAEQSTLAFYAAQSGVEDGVQKVLARLLMMSPVLRRPVIRRPTR